MTVAQNLIPIGAALLDAISVGESAGDYWVLCGGKPFDRSDGGFFTKDTPKRDGYYGFPDWDGWLAEGRSENERSHAAGRYQFEPATWKDAAEACGLTDFSDPAQQDVGALWLARRDYKVRSGGGDLMTALYSGALEQVAGHLRQTWTSLDPDTLPGRYLAALQTIKARSPAPTPPAPEPSPAPAPSDPAPSQAPPSAPGVGAGLAIGGGAAALFAKPIIYLVAALHLPDMDMDTAAGFAAMIPLIVGWLAHRKAQQ